MDFDRICMMFAIQEPFYGIILSSMKKEATNRIPTIGVTRSGNTFKLNYNPKFLERFNTDTVLQMLRHEVLHIAFNHFSIWEEPTIDSTVKYLRNVAADLEINGYLDRNKIQPECKALFPEDFGFDKFEGTREYFRKLVKQMEDNRQENTGDPEDKPCNGGKTNKPSQDENDENDEDDENDDENMDQNGVDTDSDNQSQPDGDSDDNTQGGTPIDSQGNGFGNPSVSGPDKEFLDSLESFDDHNEWPDGEDDQNELSQMEEMVNDLLKMAADECEKSCGDIPLEIRERIEKLRAKPRPVTDWKRYFRRYVGNEFSDIIKKSRKRESRRFPDAPGNRKRRKSHILVAIDTSGSVCMPEYKEFFGQIKTLAENATFHVVECDTRIAHEYDFDGRIHDDVHGRGGTSFQPPVDLFINNRKKYDALVYFTDGYAPIPTNTPKETLWVISSDGNHDRKRYTVNGASVVFIQKQSHE